MAAPFNSLLALLGLAPLLSLLSSQGAGEAQMLVVGVGLILLAVGLRGSDVDQIRRSLAGVGWAVLLMPLYLIVQLLPLPGPVAHTIWKSAGEALQMSAVAAITVDRGDTLFALMTAASTLGLLIVTIAIARDRRRAELTLRGAAAVATLMGLAALVVSLIDARLPLHSAVRPGAVALIGGLAIVLDAALVIAALERFTARRSAAAEIAPTVLIAIIGLLISGAVLIRAGGLPQIVAVGLGVGCLTTLAVIRRFDMSRASAVVLCVIGGLASAVLIVWLGDENAAAGSLLLRFVAPSQDMPQLEAMVADARWLGAGAGAFQDLARLYQGGGASGAPTAPTVAVARAVELGWLGCVGAVAAGSAILVKLAGAALERGRDWIYPAVAAVGLALGATSVLLDNALCTSAAGILLTVTIGLGLAQSYSQ